MSDLVTIEELLEEIPIRIQKDIETACPCCGEFKNKTYIYELQIEVLQIDKKKRYKMYYLCRNFSLGSPLRYIGQATGTGFKTMKKALEELKGYI